MNAAKMATEPNVVCLLAPEGADESTISKGWGSQSIIGLEQYRLITNYSGIRNVCLYDENRPVDPNDILLVMMCLPVAKYETLCKFQNVIYYFDDMNVRKARQADYADKIAKLLAYISPLKSIANEMNKSNIVQSYYMPWSMDSPDFEVIKSDRPSVFIDMDERDFTKDSIERGYNFAQLCVDLEMSVHVFEKFENWCPDSLKEKLIFTPRMAPEKFRRLLSTMWFYASGIRGSYEYSVLEAAMLGCGLISIHSAILREHMERPFCLVFEEQVNFDQELKTFIKSFNKDIITSSARSHYPQNSSIALSNIISQSLSINNKSL